MNIRYILSLLFCLVVFAQIRKTAFRLHQRDTVAAYVRSYTDSLKIYKARLDSLQQVNDSLKAEKELDARYYRLFAPLTFYYNIAKKQFDLSSDTVLDEPDRTLLSVYMSRPALFWSLKSNSIRREPYVRQSVRLSHLRLILLRKLRRMSLSLMSRRWILL